MHFVFNATDKPDHVQIRLKNRAAHLKYNTESQKYGVTVITGGPKIDENGDMIGSCMILEADSRETVEQFLANDPYTNANLFATTELKSYKLAFKDGQCML